jgi:activator of 2-hydroxyglutaryl-CoA dehydratase
MDIQAIKSTIENGNAVLGIEMGSTRIKAVLIDEKHNPIKSAVMLELVKADDGTLKTVYNTTVNP